MQQVTAVYQAQLDSSENLVEPIACITQVTTDHAEGSAATRVTITVSEACRGMAYQSAQMDALITQTLQLHSLGGSYYLSHLSLHIQITVNNAHAGDLQVKTQGALIYQWSRLQQNALAALIAGKSEIEATALLLQQPGVSAVNIHMMGRNTGTLPDNPDSIRFAFLATKL